MAANNLIAILLLIVKYSLKIIPYYIFILTFHIVSNIWLINAICSFHFKHSRSSRCSNSSPTVISIPGVILRHSSSIQFHKSSTGASFVI